MNVLARKAGELDCMRMPVFFVSGPRPAAVSLILVKFSRIGVSWYPKLVFPCLPRRQRVGVLISARNSS